MKNTGYGLILVLGLVHAAGAWAQDNRNLAPGFTTLPKGAKVVVMPTDVELFSVAAGGIAEPRADWTEAAVKHLRAALDKKKQALGFEPTSISEKDADELADVNALHGAMARSINLHHYMGMLSLPTKAGKLDWSMGDSVQAVKKATGADYALFSWMRDSYTSSERAAAIVLMAILTRGQSVGGGGMQQGYASLVDLNTGRVLWFNRLIRQSGDLREAEKAAETVDALLAQFPAAK